jgi:hypothetical protein
MAAPAKTEVAYFPGCSLHSSSEIYDHQCKVVLAKLDIALREIATGTRATSAAKIDGFLVRCRRATSASRTPRASPS